MAGTDRPELLADAARCAYQADRIPDAVHLLEQALRELPTQETVRQALLEEALGSYLARTDGPRAVEALQEAYRLLEHTDKIGERARVTDRPSRHSCTRAAPPSSRSTSPTSSSRTCRKSRASAATPRSLGLQERRHRGWITRNVGFAAITRLTGGPGDRHELRQLEIAMSGIPSKIKARWCASSTA